MPLVRIDALRADEARLDALGRAVHEALVETIGFPPDDRFQVLVSHDDEGTNQSFTHSGGATLSQPCTALPCPSGVHPAE